MTHLSTRKRFFAKILAWTAAMGVGARLSAAPRTAPTISPETAGAAAGSRVAVRRDTRAVARGDAA